MNLPKREDALDGYRALRDHLITKFGHLFDDQLTTSEIIMKIVDRVDDDLVRSIHDICEICNGSGWSGQGRPCTCPTGERMQREYPELK